MLFLYILNNQFLSIIHCFHLYLLILLLLLILIQFFHYIKLLLEIYHFLLKQIHHKIYQLLFLVIIPNQQLMKEEMIVYELLLQIFHRSILGLNLLKIQLFYMVLFLLLLIHCFFPVYVILK